MYGDDGKGGYIINIRYSKDNGRDNEILIILFWITKWKYLLNNEQRIKIILSTPTSNGVFI